MPWLRYDYSASLGPSTAGFVLSCSSSGRTRSATREAAAGLRAAAVAVGAAPGAGGEGGGEAGDAAAPHPAAADPASAGAMGVVKMGCRGLSLLVWKPPPAPAAAAGQQAGATAPPSTAPLLHAASRAAAALAIGAGTAAQPRLACCERVVGFDGCVAPRGGAAALEAAAAAMVEAAWRDGWVRPAGAAAAAAAAGGDSTPPPAPTTFAIIYRRHATAGPGSERTNGASPPLERASAIGAAARGVAAGLASAGAPGPHSVCLAGGPVAGPTLALAVEVLPARPPGGGPPAIWAALGLVPRAALEPGARDVRVRRVGGRERRERRGGAGGG